MHIRSKASRLAVGLIGGAVISTGIWAGGALAGAAPSAARAQSPGHDQPARPAPLWQTMRAHAVPARPDAAMTFEYLDGVYCTSRSNCWSVGLRATAHAFLAQARQWNGRTWVKRAVPSPGGTGTDELTEPSAVRCASASECWTVGFYGKTGGVALNLMLRWNGRKWTAMSVPQPAGTGKTAQNFLNDVTCVSARNCWAVGYFGKTNSSTLNEVLHWNGKKWTRMRVPEPGGTGKQAENKLNNVRCPTSSRCIAVGSYTSGSGKTFSQALIWGGKTWSSQHVPSPGSGTAKNASILYGLGCGSGNSCWAVGTFGPSNSDKTLNQVMHWNGRSWSRQFTAQPAGTGNAAQNDLAWVTCSSDRNCWTVGAYGNSGPGTSRNQALHWNGRRWAFVHTPNPAGTAMRDQNVLLSDRCPTSSDCWAVGGQVSSTGNVSHEILHWNGKKWSVWT
jgi:hypothetical protein